MAHNQGESTKARFGGYVGAEMLAKVALTLASTALTAGALAAGYQLTTGNPLLEQVAQFFEPAPSPWGFELSFESLGEGGYCGTCEYAKTHTSWQEGPRGGFIWRDPRELARDSLAWLERTVNSDAWRDRGWLQLELAYPSGWRVVRVAHANGTALSWDKQLADWFERLPPTVHGGWPDESGPSEFEWTLTFETGNVQGWSESTPEALEVVRELACSLETAPGFGAVTVKLDYPSGRIAVELERAIDSQQAPLGSWPQPLAAWLERFPPAVETTLSDGAEETPYRWSLTFAELGEIRSWTATASEAIEAMRGLAASLEGLPGIGLVTYELGRSESVPDPDRVVTNLYLVETAEASELDELPRKLAEKAMPFCSTITSR